MAKENNVELEVIKNNDPLVYSNAVNINASYFDFTFVLQVKY